jgi:hypothetical protein
VFTYFAGPLDLPDEAEDVIRLVATEHYRGVGKRFVSRFGKVIEENSAGLVDYIVDHLSRDLNLPMVWRPSFGVAKQALREHGAHLADSTTIAVELAMAFEPSRGTKYHYSFALAKPTRIALGRFIIPVISSARVDLSDSALHVEFPDTPSLTFRKEYDGFIFGGWEGHAVERMPQLRIGDHQINFVTESFLDGRDGGQIPFPVSGRGEDLLPAWLEAYALVANVSPEYLNWITRAIQYVVPVRAPNGSMVSGSQGHRPGEVYMTDALEPIKLAEMLIHEASHQHFQIVTFLGPVQDGTDDQLYYSPVVQKPRPIDKVLLAYHAFANVLFLRMCQNRAVGDQGFLEANLRRLHEEVEILQKPLETSSGLTEIGNGLWRPLAERL